MTNGSNIPTPCIRDWLRDLGTSWTEMRRYSIKRTKLRRSLRDAIYRRQSAPLKCHEGTRNATSRSRRHG
jgi:hypothetical protein